VLGAGEDWVLGAGLMFKVQSLMFNECFIAENN
jgi:hypothetical protein